MINEKDYVNTQARALVLLPYLHSQDGPKVFVWTIPQSQNVPGYHDCDLDEFVKKQLWTAAGEERAEPLWLLAKGTPFVMLIEDDGRPAFDPNHDQEETCKCGHPYRRHYDGDADDRPVGCKYCSCELFESDPEGGYKYTDVLCGECHAKLSPFPEDNWCAKCGKVMEPWSREYDLRKMAEQDSASE